MTSSGTAPQLDPLDLTLPCLIHDLNNVFQTLIEAGDLLSTDPQWAELSAVILRSVERGKGITTSLEATEHSRASLENILNRAIAFVEDSLIGGRSPNITFHCELEAGLELRRNLAWERVFVNLFSNSVRAMPEGGAIQVRAWKRGQWIEIIVRDDGAGIPPEILGDVFKPHVSTKASGGLGLHIVETMVIQSGGNVRAANRADGRGAEFTITVPLDSH